MQPAKPWHGRVGRSAAGTVATRSPRFPASAPIVWNSHPSAGGSGLFRSSRSWASSLSARPCSRPRREGSRPDPPRIRPARGPPRAQRAHRRSPRRARPRRRLPSHRRWQRGRQGRPRRRGRRRRRRPRQPALWLRPHRLRRARHPRRPPSSV